jgi:DNA-binding CsgD family transcriptional regulator
MHKHDRISPVRPRQDADTALPTNEPPTALDLLDCMGCAILLLDAMGTVTGVNARAKPLLGTDLSIHRGRLTAADHTSNQRLQSLVRAAPTAMPLDDDLLPPVVVARREGRPIVVQVLPAAGLAGALGEGARAILLLTDLEAQPELPERRLMRLFGLTPAEARLAARLGSGETLEETAEALQVSLGTARNQLKAVFAKTQTSRQAELIALLWRISDMASSSAGAT